jgi:esterase/lipase
LQQPVYLIAAQQDDMVPPNFVEEAFEKIPHEAKRLTRFDCSHYGIYLGKIAEENAENQAVFLAEVFNLTSATDGFHLTV